jgi:hypothetical protein
MATILVVNHAYEATVKAFKVDHEYATDICVFVVAMITTLKEMHAGIMPNNMGHHQKYFGCTMTTRPTLKCSL